MQDFPPLCPQECVQAPANSFLMVWNIKCSDVSSLFAFIEAKIKWSFMRQIFFFTCSFFVTSGKPQVWQELHVCTLVYVCESACVFSYSICLHMVLVQTCMYFEATERLQRVSFQNPNFPQKETQSILVWLKKFFRHAKKWITSFSVWFNKCSNLYKNQNNCFCHCNINLEFSSVQLNSASFMLCQGWRLFLLSKQLFCWCCCHFKSLLTASMQTLVSCCYPKS